MHTSETINEIATALAKVQGLIKNPAKESENPHFKNRYADLSQGLNAVRPILSEHSIALVQMTRMDGELMMLDTRLVHSSGQWIESSYPVCKFPTRQQEAGSALTYARRYSLFALVGIAGADEDDDGNDASREQTPAPSRQAARPRPAPAAAPKNHLPAEDSAKALRVLLGTMDMCVSLDGLSGWAKDNKSAIERLQPDDQEQVREAWASMRERLSSDEYPQAAE